MNISITKKKKKLKNRKKQIKRKSWEQILSNYSTLLISDRQNTDPAANS